MDYKLILENNREPETHKIVTDPAILGKKVMDLSQTPNEISDCYGADQLVIVAADEFIKDPDSSFDSEYLAEKFLEEKGYSVGRMQAGSPRGFMKGNYDIMKWRNLDRNDKAGLDGILVSYSKDRTVAYFFKMPE